MKAKDEQNNILLPKIHNNEKEKNKKPKHNIPKTTPYKRKGKKLEFSSHGDETSNEELVKHHTEKKQDSSGSNDDNKTKISINHMKNSLGNLKRVHHQCLTVRLKKEKRWNLGYE